MTTRTGTAGSGPRNFGTSFSDAIPVRPLLFRCFQDEEVAWNLLQVSVRADRSRSGPGRRGKVVEIRKVTDNVMLVGIVVPIAWKRSGKVRAVALNTQDERQYRIDPSRSQGKNLAAHIGDRIRVEGELGAGDALCVARFEVLESFSAGARS